MSYSASDFEINNPKSGATYPADQIGRYNVPGPQMPGLPSPKAITEPVELAPLPPQLKGKNVPEVIQRFLRSTEEAQRAFNALTNKVTDLRSELDETNEQLREKVDDLDALSSHLVCLLESLSDGVVAVDKRRSICVFNPAAEKIIGKPGATYLRKGIDSLVPANTPLAEQIDQALTGSEDLPRLQVLFPRENDEAALPASSKVSSVKNKDGSVIGAVIVLQDLQELTTLQRDLSRAEGLAELGRMSAVVAHEIRNPLGGIEGFASLLQMDLSEDPEKKRYADMIVHGIQDLNRLVSSLLDFAKAPKLKMDVVDLELLLNELVQLALHDQQEQSKNIQLDFKKEAKKTELLADRGALRQVFLNLMRNAIEAMREMAKGELRIRLLNAELNGSLALQIDIADSGPGVPEKVKDTLFKPFVTTKKKGTGLGLPTVAKLIAAHGGRVTCVDEVSGGACFQVILPMNATGMIVEESNAN